MTTQRIIWTEIDEAPALATYSLLPIVQAFTKGTGISVETRDISVAGRIIAAGVVSSMDVPPFARAAMDGYAVAAADTRRASSTRPVRLRIAERVYTAEVARAPLGGRPARMSTTRSACGMRFSLRPEKPAVPDRAHEGTGLASVTRSG